MPWHLSKSDPRKVYDERHQVVCVCQTAEQARLIVSKMTGNQIEAQVIPLREPLPLGPLGPLETFHDDDCCKKHLMHAARVGINIWTCPKCGCEWKPRIIGEMRHWEPVTMIAVFR